MVDVAVRGEQDGRQFAGQADQGPVEDGLLLSFDFFRLPSELFGPQNGGDTPPEPLGRLPLPHLVFGILHGHMLLPRDFLLWCAGESRVGGKKGKEGVSSCQVIRPLCKCVLMEEILVYFEGKQLVIVEPITWKSRVILVPLKVKTGSPRLRLALVLASLAERSCQQVASPAFFLLQTIRQ